LVRVVGPVACIGKFNGCFDLIKEEFDGLGRIECCAHLGVVVLDVDRSDDAICCVEMSENVHGGDVVIARVPIAKATYVRFVECVDELLLESFAGGVVFVPDTEVFFVLLDGFIDLGGSSAVGQT
jgi:hypothetical protein